MSVLIFNFIAYGLWLYYIWKKDKKITIYFILLAFYTFVALMGVYTVFSGIYQDTFGDLGITQIKTLPYFYCFVTYVILLYPFRHLSIDFSNNSFLFSKTMKNIVRIWKAYFSVYTVLRLNEAVQTVSSGLGDAYESRHMEGEVLFEYNNVILEKIIGYGTFLSTATIPIIMSYALIGLSKKHVTFKESILLIALSFIPQFANSIAMGSRGALFMNALCFSFFLILLWNYTPKKLIRVSVIFFITTLCVVSFYSWGITIDRLDDENEGLNSIMRYFGEPFPNLGIKYWDQVIVHPMGLRLFPNLFDFEVEGSTQEVYDYWFSITGVSVMNFKTYFGDLYIEFDVVGAFIFVILYSIIMYFIIKSKRLGFLKLPIVYYYYQLCVYAFAGMTKDGHHATFELMVVLIVTIVIHFLQKPITDLHIKDENSRFSSV